MSNISLRKARYDILSDLCRTAVHAGCEMCGSLPCLDICS